MEDNLRRVRAFYALNAHHLHLLADDDVLHGAEDVPEVVGVGGARHERVDWLLLVVDSMLSLFLNYAQIQYNNDKLKESKQITGIGTRWQWQG